jgi:hypothetical protein
MADLAHDRARIEPIAGELEEALAVGAGSRVAGHAHDNVASPGDGKLRFRPSLTSWRPDRLVLCVARLTERLKLGGRRSRLWT